MRAAHAIAARIDSGDASPRPAMSNAVPWAGLVRTKGNPSVTLTARSNASALTGASPWSW